jgi:mannose-6-phosphate isomerase class I
MRGNINKMRDEKMSKPDAAQRCRRKSDRRRQVQVALALQEFAEMTGYRPKVVTEALIRLRREGKTDHSIPVNMKRFRELLDAIDQGCSHELKARTEDKTTKDETHK